MLTIQFVTSDEGMESGADWGSSLPVTCISTNGYVSNFNMLHIPITRQQAPKLVFGVVAVW